MLHIRSLSKSFGSKTLFENADAHLSDRDRVALIGPNGAGKTTLIRMILGQDHSDQGEIMTRRHSRIGHLAQELPKFANRTVMEEVMSLDGRREGILKHKAQIEKDLGDRGDDESLLEEYSRVLEEFDAFDEYRLPSRAEQILEGVGFKSADFHRNLSEFSGGWLMRVALARVLLLQPDLLILDEPTNHLDLESVLWLEEFLRGYKGAILMVSHDRAFLNRLVNQVWEIDQRRINTYSGNLDAYVVQKEERLKVLESEHSGQVQKVAELRAFIERFGAKASKARQAQSRMKQLEKIESEMIELPESRAHIGFKFPPCPPSGKEVITLKRAGIRYGEKLIFSGFDWILQRGSRVAIVGVNGAGKTTLLKSLAQALPLSEGSLKLGHQVQIGYYSQLQAESLDLDRTIFEELELTAPKLTISQIRGIAGAFLFQGEAVNKKIRVLSGGEKARVALAKLLLLPNNFLLLDEPTNHLDAESREVLLQALMNYEGTLCLVSHDRDFVAPLVDQLLEMKSQQVIPLVSTYEEYLALKVQEAKERVKRREPDVKAAVSADTGSSPMQKTQGKPSNNQVRSWEREFERIETDIQKLEAKLTQINERLSTEDFSQKQPELHALIAEQSEKQRQLDQKLKRWEELGSLLSN